MIRPKAKANDARALALDVCSQVVLHHRSLTEQLDRARNQLQSERDHAFLRQLCFGFCRYYFLLNAQLQPLLSKGLKKKDADIAIILILGMLQIRFMRVSDHAAVNESVKLLKVIGKPWAKGLVNAVLRNYLRQGVGTGSDELSSIEHAASFPVWMVEKIQHDWADQAAGILQSSNQLPPMTLRVDVNRIARNQLIDQYRQAGIEVAPHSMVDSAVVLSDSADVFDLPGFAEGLVSVQDASAQLAAGLLDCQPQMRVLDACAAPGGKSLHLLQRTPGIHLSALDKDQQRLQRIQQNLDRAKLNAELICADAADTQQWWDGQLFDRILLDVPCSASGILRRHPDIRLLRQPSDISRLVTEQQRLMQAMWSMLKPGGKLLYSTCSVFKDENEHQIKTFIESRDNGREVDLKTVQWGQQRPHGRQILSGNDGMDGFYYACLTKQNDNDGVRS